MRTALTIAGSDSSGGAGIQADLKTFAAFGLYGASAITAVTAQSTKGIEATLALPADLVTAQIEAVAGDYTIHATKIGMLANAAIVEAVAAAIAELELPLVVVDPVLVSSSGERLLDEDGVRALCAELLPRARVLTPNIAEAEALTGCRIESLDDAREAARRMHKMGAAAVIITGGHALGAAHPAPRTSHLEVIDLLFDGHVFYEFRVARVESRHTHGTGCTFASAVAAGLALGGELPDAAARAQQYVAGAIAHAPGIGHGRGPLDHFWERRSGDRNVL
jgi:hydroxymethylpyrimidine/phosphomethylpyrimidine kinase